MRMFVLPYVGLYILHILHTTYTSIRMCILSCVCVYSYRTINKRDNNKKKNC